MNRRDGRLYLVGALLVAGLVGSVWAAGLAGAVDLPAPTDVGDAARVDAIQAAVPPAQEPVPIEIRYLGAPPPSPRRPAALSATRQITYTYDASGRLTGVSYGDGRSITYSYDAAGNIVRRQAAGNTPTPTPTATAGAATPTATSTATATSGAATATATPDAATGTATTTPTVATPTSTATAGTTTPILGAPSATPTPSVGTLATRTPTPGAGTPSVTTTPSDVAPTATMTPGVAIPTATASPTLGPGVLTVTATPGVGTPTVTATPAAVPTGTTTPEASPTPTRTPAATATTVATIAPTPGSTQVVSLPGVSGTLYVPGDAAGTTPLVATVRVVGPPPSAPVSVTVLAALEISFADATSGAPVTDLNREVVIELSYAGLNLTEAQLGQLTIYNATRGEYLSTTLDRARRVAIARTPRFSLFTLALVTGPVPRLYLPLYLPPAHTALGGSR